MNESSQHFNGESYEDALKNGLEQLKLSKDEVNVKVVAEKKGTFFKRASIVLEITPKAVGSSDNNIINKAVNKVKNVHEDKDQPIRFKISYTQEGVFLKVYFFERQTELLTSILEYIKIKEIKDVDTNIIKTYINEENTEDMYIAPAQNEVLVDEDIEIEFSKDKMQCFIILKKAYGGKGITIGYIKKKLNEAGVIHGIKEEVINNFANKKQYDEKFLIAEGKRPINGSNGRIVYYFDVENSNSPQVLADGSVDFKQLNNIKNVQTDELLAEIIPPTDGESGYDVLGIEIPSLPGKNINFKKGKNTKESDDGLKLFATRSGQVILKDGAITVSEVFEVPGDVDNSTGNIKFNGKVIVRGNVKSGFSIEANGDIIIYGVVEGAKLKATGDIIVNRGVQGNNQAYLECDGNLIAKYIENAKVCVQENIEADCILHSCAIAKSKISIAGKKGLIAGGEVRAGKEISALTIGSHMGTSTKLEVGMDPEIKRKISDVKNEILDIENKLDGLKKSIELLNRLKKNGGLSPQKEEVFIKTLKAYEILKEKLGLLGIELNKLDSNLETKINGKIHASKTMYPGVKVTIINASRQLYDEISNCTLSLADGEVIIGPYEK